MLKLIKSLFSGSPSSDQPSTEATVEYNGFRITPCPKNAQGGWSTEALIEKEIDGETRQHHFIRADHSSGKDAAVELTLSKARTTVDQLGDGIFR